MLNNLPAATELLISRSMIGIQKKYRDAQNLKIIFYENIAITL